MMQIPIVNQKTKSIRPRSRDASSGSQGRRTATAVAMPPATMPIPSKPRMEPLRIRGGAYRNRFPEPAGPATGNRFRSFQEGQPLAAYAVPKKGDEYMGLGGGIFLAAVGAVVAFALSKAVSGVDIHTIGWILMIVGIVGIVLSMIFWSSWAGPGYFSRRQTTYVDEGPPGPTH